MATICRRYMHNYGNAILSLYVSLCGRFGISIGMAITAKAMATTMRPKATNLWRPQVSAEVYNDEFALYRDDFFVIIDQKSCGVLIPFICSHVVG